VRLSKIPWRTQESGLKLEREKATTNQFDVGGRRILIVGTEQDGVEEVWTHPVRILRNIRIGFRVGSDLRWSESFSPKVTARPESFTREFSLGTCTIRETTFANLDRPSGGIHFEVHGENLEILITGEIDLRMMWPLSENATGSLEYSVSNGFEKVVVQNNSGKLCAIVGCSHNSVQILVDHGKPFVNSDGSLQFKPTSAAVVAFGMRIRPGGQTSHCTMCFSGSHQGLGEAEKAYRAFMRSPVMAYNKQVTYYKRLLASLPKLRVASDMLEAFKWAAVSLDRFFVETPGVGQSLMAGYSTTRSGWGGGHAISGRPGYAWYFGRDAVWSCLALLALKRYKQVRAVLEFLGRYQDINGKILHECTTSGFVHYDAADSTTLYVYLIGRYLRATNDKKFAKTQFPKILKAMEFCFGTDRDGDHLIENTGVGHGWVEGGPLFPAHAELYLNACWAAALQEATYVAQRLKRRKEQVEWKTERAIVNQIINEEFWDHETGLYNYAKNSDGSFKTEKTILPAVAMLFALTDPRKAGACLEEYASEKFSTDWGVRLIGRESSSYNPEGYHYGSIWPLFTGWAALASFAMGRQDLALKHVGRNLSLHRRFSLGCMPEVLHGERCDVAGLCARQAWSEAMVVLGVVGAVNRGE
jgi:glycogen debranching enzyme